MRKHKSVVAILLAVMMIFTFMPTMAFADDVTPAAPEFSKDYTTLTYDGRTYNTVREFVGSTGLVHVTANTEGMAGVPPEVTKAAADYYDLNNAVFAFSEADGAVQGEYLTPKSWTDAVAYGVNGFIFSAPSYVKNATETAKPYVALAILNGGKWQGAIKGYNKYDATKDTEDQTLTISVDVTYRTTGNGTVVLGAIADKTVKVDGKAKGTPENAVFYIDEVKGTGSSDGLYVDYDGADHTVVMGAIKGYTVKYTVFNSKTGAWDPADTVTVKEPGETDVTATIYDSEGKKVPGCEFVFPVVVRAVTRAQVVFDEDGDGGPYTYKVNKGSLFDPTDFLKVEAVSYVEGRTRNNRYSQWRSQTHTVTDADKAAVAANKDEIIACFKDYYEIEQSSTKANPDEVILTIKEKDLSKLSDEEREALAKKYENLFSKFVSETYEQTGTAAKTHWQYIDGIVVDTDQTGTIEFVSTPVVNDKDDDITFSGVTSKSFKAKKKTKKLAKTKTFQVAAVADSGNVVTFSATSSNAKVSIDATGKVTVKKGLKKGAKVKLVVKAKTAAGNGYKAASAEKTYTIKIK